MSDLSINPDSQAGLQAEDHILEYLAKRFDREERDWVLIHSVCSNSDSLDSVKRLPNVLTWIETPKKNAQLGDIRIASRDVHGRPVRDYCVYVDVKYSKRWDYASITFRRTGESAKKDAIAHLCNFIGKDVSPFDFWYLTLGNRGTYIVSLFDVQGFIQGASEEKMLEICKPGKYNNVDTWYMSFEEIIKHNHTYDLEIWIQEVLSQRLG